ncbi:thioredoxin TrxC [Solirhodobacter olei]|uniref:thioredoxin TrxC n=1 Tax=Solirhodobacter olei TaxID=2493082 RepID=UPI000FD6E6C8|nr:thioredoxin TrxC [Solirhodobacter olei]
MAEAVRLTCPECGQANRVPVGKLSAGPKCGVCGAKLADGAVGTFDMTTLSKAVKGDDLPLIVDFWAPWCGPCRMMAPEFARAGKALAGRARFAKIDTERHPQASQSFGIRGIPLLILFHRGREVARLSGARPAAEIERFVREHVALPA